jgi:serine/threonine protein kinase
MTCQKCGSSIREDAKFCPNCGTPAGQPEVDPRIYGIEKALNFKYKILKKIGVGGFAEVYLGEHTQLGRKVAIKILRHGFAGEDEMIERFRRESKSAAKLSHPNIIDIYDVGENEGIYYFVMKYVEGETLGKKMQRDRKVAPNEAVFIIKQVADALAYAHDHDVIHRDIKPANVMLDAYKKPILMDFGIARVQFEGNLTKTGTLMGTPHYLPPEQPLGRPVDGRSDTYSLGIMFYEMLAGRPPFHDENSVTLIFKHINEAPPPLVDANPELAPELCEVVHKMIEKLPENRYQSAGDVVEALDALADIYPVNTPTAGKRTSGSTRNTDQLLQLARENLELQKFDKAIEIYATIVKRDPENPVAQQAVVDVSSILADRMRKHVDEHQFTEARLLLTQLVKLPGSSDVAANMKITLESAEQSHAKESEFRDHLNAARVALDHDNASGAIDKLTKALIVDPANHEAQTMLKHARALYESNRQKAEYANAYSEAEYYFDKSSYDQALVAIRKALDIQNDAAAMEMYDRIQAAQKEKAYKQSEQERILSQVDQLCEALNFDEALEVLEGARNDLPVFAESKIGVVERNRNLYELFERAKTSFQSRSWGEAVAEFNEFLEKKPPYDFQVFYGLRKEAEESLKLAEKETSMVGAGTEKRAKQAISARLKSVDTFLRMGQYEKAKEECLGILKTYPDNPEAQKKLKEINEILAPQKIDTDEIKKLAKAAEDFPNQTVQVPVPSGRVPVVPPAPQPPPPKAERKTPAPVASAPKPRPAAPALRSADPQPAVVQRSPETTEPRSFPLNLILGGVGALLVIGFLLIFFWPSDKGVPDNTGSTTGPTGGTSTNGPTTTTDNPPPVLPKVSVSIDVLPWAKVNISGGGLKESITETTPAIISLPPGRYVLVFENPDLRTFKEEVDINEGNRIFNFAFRDFDARKVADSLVE